VITDARTVAWKELKEIVAQRAGAKGQRSFWRTAVIPVLIGVFFGLQTARGDYGFAVFPVGFFAMTTAASMVTDAIAGERERHTLETLLASPASDTAILIGKLAAVVGYAWVLALAQLGAIEITSIAIGHTLPPELVVLIAVLSLFEAVLAAGFGVQFSLRAPTVRAAARKLGLLSFVVVIPVSLLNSLVVSEHGGDYYPLIVAAALVGLAVVDAAMLSLVKTRFRRGQLLLD
jgi:ABC-2 type transport system permease protein